MYVQKKTRGNNIICRLLQGLWLRTQREDGANTTRQRPTQRNCRSHKIHRSKRRSGRVGTAIWMHHMDTNKMYGEKAWRQLHKNGANNIKQFLEAAPHESTAVRPPSTHHENYPR